MGNKIDIKASLTKFRNHWIHENDVRPLLEMEESARNELETILKTVPDDKLKESLREYIRRLPLMDSLGTDWVIDHNELSKLKAAFAILLDDKKKEYEKLDAMMSLEGIGPVISSQFLDVATRGNYIIYDRNLIRALHEVEPGLLKEDFIEARNRRDLEYVMEACQKFYNKYGLTSYAELRCFLRNGYVSEWAFDDF